ncbi:hypothetical protein NQ318_007142 [Aromia moschata]|uniref:Uncharacterized protein n=1 Tax=Aromia moschata TaxID=1265417 RepID=A0AAV8XNT3_9CUCU|nr:hypothetical protein NQ318_007142 [Aromia moschata]
MLQWVEMALAQEIQNHYGLTHYLLAAVCLYQQFYAHALEHIEETKNSYGSLHLEDQEPWSPSPSPRFSLEFGLKLNENGYSGDYAVAALSGHCLLALDRQKEAKEEYEHVLQSFSRPEDVHMVYVNCARVLESMEDRQTARKLMLLACKYSPTPYTWFKTGQLAEECFTESNYEDNRCAEVWAYLALVNLKLSRINEAELCYRQAVRHKLKCPGLTDLVEDEFKKIQIQKP